MEKNWHVATFGGGCFWCMVPPFENLSGVKKVVSGYMGGDTPHPTYAEVSEGNSGYLEVVQVEFDPALAPYRKLLDVFWRNIDPTDSKGQFADRGRQYQTAIFFHTPDQETEARRSKEDLAASGRFNAPIVTDIRPAKIFYPAEDYHQDYHKKNPLRYGLYRQGSGRDRFIKKAWGDRDNDVDPANNPKIIERKKTLTPIQYRVTQECGTEPPFDNEYWDNHEEGIYVDIVSGEPLFISKDKFDSGTGWPSFTRPLEPDNIVEKIDAGLLTRRTEVRSKKGGSHLGHVFDDGPGPTGLRYCINSAALKFIPVADLEKEGYGKYLSVFSLESSGAPTRKRR